LTSNYYNPNQVLNGKIYQIWRNVLAHDYRGVDEDIVFRVVKIELPRLKLVLIQFLKFFSANQVKEVLETKQYKHLKEFI
jgi:uncharacterized protein with HEPN domain